MNSEYEIGIIGLGVMGHNFLLNIADHGFSVLGYDRDPSKIQSLPDIEGISDLKEFIRLLRRPRAILLLVPAGAPVDEVIQNLLPYLQPDDLIIDAGNSYFKDTNRRTEELAKAGIQFLGVGVSGGEEGARHGPSIMPAGNKKAYERVAAIFEAVAAKINNVPCVTYLGAGSAGHFVKMVHNGIEYGIMQLIAETYDLMKRGLGLNDDEISALYHDWSQGSYLLEITSRIFKKMDPTTGKHLINEILDCARQNGTGMWTTQSALELQIPTPTIDVAVNMRDLSVLIDERKKASSLYPNPQSDSKILLEQLQSALSLSTLMTYAQGFALLSVASRQYNYHLNLEAVARIWRGGCIIRSPILNNIEAAYRQSPQIPNLLLHSDIANQVKEHEQGLRSVISSAALSGLPIPGLMSALGYLDSYRSAWSPANLIQAQRDYFGAHTYERIDNPGVFVHTEWEL